MKKILIALMFLGATIGVTFNPMSAQAQAPTLTEEVAPAPVPDETPVVADPAPALPLATDLDVLPAAATDEKPAVAPDSVPAPQPAMTPAPVAPDKLVSLFQSKAWSALAGAVILLLIWLANTFGLKNVVPPAGIPWIAAAIGILSAIGTNLYAGGPWVDAVFGGFTSGATSVGLWQMVFQKFLPQGVSTQDVHEAVAKGVIKPKK